MKEPEREEEASRSSVKASIACMMERLIFSVFYLVCRSKNVALRLYKHARLVQAAHLLFRRLSFATREYLILVGEDERGAIRASRDVRFSL